MIEPIVDLPIAPEAMDYRKSFQIVPGNRWGLFLIAQ
jgi:hypothetical protein